jgi:hypothetical protein
MIDQLQAGDAKFDFLVQPRTSDAMSVEDSQNEWTEAHAPFHKVATITIPKQLSQSRSSLHRSVMRWPRISPSILGMSCRSIARLVVSIAFVVSSTKRSRACDGAKQRFAERADRIGGPGTGTTYHRSGPQID